MYCTYLYTYLVILVAMALVLWRDGSLDSVKQVADLQPPKRERRLRSAREEGGGDGGLETQDWEETWRSLIV